MTGPLDDCRRRRLFLAAAAVVALAAAVLFPRGHQDRPTPSPRPTARPATVQVAPSPHPRSQPQPRGLSRRADRRRIEATNHAAAPVARRFAAAFIAYGDGDGAPRTRRILSATSTPPFARRLLSSPPRPLTRPHTGRVVAIQVSEDRSPTGLPVLVTIRRGRRTTQIPLLLERKDARWLVADLAG